MMTQICLRGPPKKNNDVELWEDEVLTVKLLLWSVQLLLLLLVQFLVLRLFSKICHQHLHPLNHLLVKVIIKLQEDKLLDRKWRKCWTIAEIKKKIKEISQRPQPVQIQGKKNFSKIYQRRQRDKITFFEKVRKVYKRMYIL